MTPSKPWKSSQFSCKIVRKLANYAIYIMICIFSRDLLWSVYTVCYCQPHCEENMLCLTASLMKKIRCVLLPATLLRRSTWLSAWLHSHSLIVIILGGIISAEGIGCQPHEEDMLCPTASLMKKICCVLLPASWRRYAVSYCQSHEEDIAVFFYKCASGAKSWAGRVCMSETC